MSNPTISSETTQSGYYPSSGSVAYARTFASENFRTLDNLFVPGGNPTDKTTCCLIQTLTVNGDKSLSFPSTTQIPYTPEGITFTTVIYDANDVKVFDWLTGYPVPQSIGSVFTWSDLQSYANSLELSSVLYPVTTYYNASQTDQRINTAVGTLNDATDAVKGRTRLSVPSTGIPIAVGTNDPRVPTQSENDALVGTSGTPSSSNKYVTNSDTRLGSGGYSVNVKNAPYSAAGDGVTDDTSAIQAAINAVAAAGGGVVYFPAGVYKVAGALQDVSASNAQLVFPKVNNSASMITVGFLGESVPPTPWNQDGGVIIRSTLSSGNGALIGVKHNQGGDESTAVRKASNISSNIFVSMEDITWRLHTNPTNSGVDVSRIRNFYARNLRIDTDDFGTGGTNPHFNPANVPQPICTEPTTSSSFGLKMPMDYLPNNCVVDGLFVGGFYNHVRTGELGRGKNIVFHCGKVGFAVEGATWPSRYENVVMAAVVRPIKTLGVTPDFTGLPDANTNATIFFDNVGIETDAEVVWSPVVYIIDDPSNYLKGTLSVFYGAGVDLPLNPAFPPNVWIRRAERPNNTREPISNITGTSLNSPGNNFAIDELKTGRAVSTDTALPWRIYTTKQSGTSNGVGVEVFANDAIADGLDKRLFQRYVTTDGAINNGKIGEYIMSGGVLNLARTLDQYGNINFAQGFIRSGEATLAISSNTIAPMTPTVHVGAGLIKNITVAPGTAASYSFDAIPDAAFTYDATGNIVVPAGGGTAVIGRVMRFTYTPSTGKFYPSY